MAFVWPGVLTEKVVRRLTRRSLGRYRKVVLEDICLTTMETTFDWIPPSECSAQTIDSSHGPENLVA